MRLHDDPTLSELVGSLIAVIAVSAILYLAIDGSAAAQTALVGLVGAASGTYFQGKGQNGNGNAKDKPAGAGKPDAGTAP